MRPLLKSSSLLAALAIALFSATCEAKPPRSDSIDLEPYRAAALKKWSKAIEALEARDRTETHPDDSILFIGSSSIRRWNTIATDIAPYHPIQRGYGGAKWTDVAVFADRLLTPHKFRAVVFFVGNDISGGNDDRTPVEVAALFAYVLDRVRRHDSESPVFYVAVTPTESRFEAWPKIKAANTAVRKLCNRNENTHFLGTESIFLNAEGKPKPELFVSDKLHLSPAGYAVWAAAIKSHLDTVLNGPKYLSPNELREH